VTVSESTEQSVSSHATAYARLVAFAFGVFCVLMAGLWITRSLTPTLLDLLTPYLGWWFEMPYVFALVGFFALLAKSPNYLRELRSARVSAVFSLALGLMSYFTSHGRSSHPMTDYHPLNPLITILIPCVWLVLIQIAIIRCCRFQQSDTSQQPANTAEPIHLRVFLVILGLVICAVFLCIKFHVF
jgi:hypothetical protein